jgi:thiol-disulfide isomerase/thioredoxin
MKNSAGKAEAQKAKAPILGERLIQFYGDECVHCHEMEPLVEKLENELGIAVVKLEVWHNDENAQLLQAVDNGMCGGIPFFFNEKSKKFICGSVPYERLKQWAIGQ